MKCFLDEGVSAQQYAEDTLDPVARSVAQAEPLIIIANQLIAILTCAQARIIIFLYVIFF